LFQFDAIYLHDTPAKSLFNREIEPSVTAVLEWKSPLGNSDFKNDKKWDERKIRGHERWEEKWYTLQNKIPVYIGYFTAWDEKMKFIF
jgi:murein L,D-transpeptidase YcbB/YkuD